MADDPEARKTETIQFHYIKSNGFRVVLADGAIGSITPQGRIMFSLYNERAPLPRVISYEFDSATGLPGNVISTESKTGIVREMEIGVVMDRATAISFRDWLSSKIEDLDKVAEQAKNMQEASARK